MRSYCESGTKDLRTESGSAPSAHGLEFQATHLASAGAGACNPLRFMFGGLQRGDGAYRHAAGRYGGQCGCTVTVHEGDWVVRLPALPLARDVPLKATLVPPSQSAPHAGRHLRRCVYPVAWHLDGSRCGCCPPRSGHCNLGQLAPRRMLHPGCCFS